MIRGAAAKRTLAALSWVSLVGCASAGAVQVDAGESVAVTPETALEFHDRVDAFYRRFTRRRFNALETFNDPVLREHFRSPDRFFDYYADLAQSLDDAHFEKSRPESVELQEFVFEDARRAIVQVRFVGEDDRPLRPDRTELVRRDRWEWLDGTWWVVPGKL